MTFRLRHKEVFALGLSSALVLFSVVRLSAPVWHRGGLKNRCARERHSQEEAAVTLSGYCPVCVIETEKARLYSGCIASV
jgi:hypothetical protein